MAAPDIKSFARIVPMIYAYNTPGITYHEGWTKIGYTEKQTVEQRIKQQTHTADIRWELAWKDNAIFKDGSGDYFTDHDFHNYLQVEKNIKREEGTEWFEIDGDSSFLLFNKFAGRQIEINKDSGCEYVLRKEQGEAVRITKEYFENGGKEFLWNAKPRFGKTLSAYDLIQKMGCKNVLIVSNRPSIANSWADDFFKFVGWKGKYCFVTDNDTLSNRKGVMTRQQYEAAMGVCSDEESKNMIAFESLQGLKGSAFFGGAYDKLRWIAAEYNDAFGTKQHGITFDLLIIDESQEGVDTDKTDRAFKNIKRKHTLYLSGTPFKQLASARFSKEQIYNWSYADEQDAKENWESENYNPYESLPRLSMYTYQLSNMIYEKLQKGASISDDEETVDFAFDLNEFFSTNESSGKFIHEEEVRRFLHALSTQEKYPYSTPELRKELSHTMWYLNRVASAKALAKLLKEDPVFCDYEVVLAAGDGRLGDDAATEAAIDRVKNAIKEHDKTITLTVGQLTVGITIREWSGVLMLCNMQSPSSYMQAAFRAQNPCKFTSEDGVRYRKENAYVFDFDPARTLIIFDEFANNLSPETVSGRGTSDDREKNIKRLLNFFPVLGEDDEGTMVELDAKQVLSIPRKIKSTEVVRHGFISNFLFTNISNVFGAPGIVREIMEKLNPAKEDQGRGNSDSLEHLNSAKVDNEGNVDVPDEIIIGRSREIFGDKIFEDMGEYLAVADSFVDGNASDMEEKLKGVVDTIKQAVKERVIAPLGDAYDLKAGAKERIEKQVGREIEEEIDKLHGDYEQRVNVAKVELERARNEAETPEEAEKAESSYDDIMQGALESFTEAVKQKVKQTIEEKPKELVEKMERRKAESEKREMEEDIRAHLRGFARTIPSFIMAYGDENLTLANFDDYTEDDVFEEVTGITEDEFRKLRDGFDYEDPDTGETKHYPGHLFDEVVFNDSIQEFLKKKSQLADYFDESHEEDIFDYIPPQRTNQIFTPKWVVVKMVDELEENNPGCFDDPDNTFADLYMKSGLYITEIVKRLFKSEGLKNAFPDENDRIRHILKKQVYGMAPTRIIYLIATNYILGFDESLKGETTHFVQADAAAAAKEGELAELVDEVFG